MWRWFFFTLYRLPLYLGSPIQSKIKTKGLICYKYVPHSYLFENFKRSLMKWHQTIAAWTVKSHLHHALCIVLEESWWIFELLKLGKTIENVYLYQGCFGHCIWHDKCLYRLSWQVFDFIRATFRENNTKDMLASHWNKYTNI